MSLQRSHVTFCLPVLGERPVVRGELRVIFQENNKIFACGGDESRARTAHVSGGMKTVALVGVCGWAWVAGWTGAAAESRQVSWVDQVPSQPTGVGRPAADRAWWDRLAKTPEGTEAILAAEKWFATPMPAFDPERYLDFTTNGNRTRYQEINTRRWDRLKRLVLGECLEGKGRFVPAIDETAKSLCGDPSWVLPAHDPGAGVFKGDAPFVDLGVAMNGYQMALSAWLLQDRLAPETLEMMREQVSKRLTGPVMKTIDGTATADVKNGHWWARCNHNWNAVCTTGAVGAILATEASPEVRAKAIGWAETNMAAFLSGFGKDGYCSEGVSYWSYGFGHFTHLAELLRWHTKGAVDLFKPAQVKIIAAAPSALELADGVYPAFADCGLNAAPDPLLVELLRWRLSAQPFSGNAAAPLAENTQIYFTLGNIAARSEAGAMGHAKAPALPLRSWFPHSGVCVARPAQGAGLSVAWKGGNNAEHHNHNDVGTTLIAWRGRPVIADPGAMVYNAKTFSKDRYRMPIMSSYGHSVPVVGGMLQAPGGKCVGKVVSQSFKDERDEILMDLASAYPDSDLKQLTRRWDYSREGDTSLVIEDRFEFGKPADFATALVGMGDWFLVNQAENETSFLMDGGHGAVLAVTVESSGPRTWQVTQVPNPGKTSPSRLGIGLMSPAAAGWIRMTITPAPSDAGSKLTKIAPATVPELLADARRAPAITATTSAPSF